MSELKCAVPISPLDVALARRFVFIRLEDDLVSRFAQRRRWRGTQVEVINAAAGIVVGYGNLLAEGAWQN